MATPPEQPWTNRERNYLLAEIIKAVDPPAEHLFNLIRGLQIQPRWEDIPLPAGRSLNSSRHAFDELWRSASTQPMVAPHTPTPLSMPTQSLKRPYSFDGLYSTGSNARAIQPRPPHPISTNYPQPTNEPPAKKKRGRPTKAEQAAKEEAKAAAAAAASTASGESASAPMSRPISQNPAPNQLPTTTASQTEEIKPVMAAAARMPIAAMLTPTAREPKSASNSGSSSSGKRRRARSNRLEMEGSENVYDSPNGRMGPGAEDSPARTAVLRHREEPSSASRGDSSAPHEAGSSHTHPSTH